MAKEKPSLLAAASAYEKPAKPTWFDKLKQKNPALAAEVEKVVDAWYAGKLPQFTAHGLTEFLVRYDGGALGARHQAILNWITSRGK